MTLLFTKKTVGTERTATPIEDIQPQRCATWHEVFARGWFSIRHPITTLLEEPRFMKMLHTLAEKSGLFVRVEWADECSSFDPHARWTGCDYYECDYIALVPRWLAYEDQMAWLDGHPGWYLLP